MSTSKRIKNIEEYEKMYDKMVRYQAVKELNPKIPMVYNLENYKLDQIDNEIESIVSSIGKVKMEVKKDKTAELGPTSLDDLTVEETQEENSEKILKKVLSEQDLNAKESSSSTYPKPQLNNSLRKLLTIKVNIAIFLRYLLLVALLVPSTLTFFLVLPFWFYNIINYTILFWTFIITTIFSSFAISYFYYYAIHDLREQKKKFQLKSYFFKHIQKRVSKILIIIKYGIFYGMIAFHFILYGLFQFIFSMPEISFILIIPLDLLFYEFFLIREGVKGNIKTDSRRTFTTLAISGLLVINVIIFFNKLSQLVIHIIPLIIVVSYLVYERNLLEKYGRFLLRLKNLWSKILKYRKPIIICGAIILYISIFLSMKYIVYTAKDSLIFLYAFYIILIPTLLIYLIGHIIRCISSYCHRDHRSKIISFWVSLIIAFGMFCIFFIFQPHNLFIPAIMIAVFTIIFTRKDDKKRPVLLIGLFGILIPFGLFSVSSIVMITGPDLEFANVPQDSRIEASPIDYSKLSYYSSIDGLEELTINNMFVSRSKISTVLGESANMHVRLIPKNVTDVEGYILKDHYDVTSKHASGPLTEFDLLTKIQLDKLNLLPGTYEIRSTYSVLTGFASRYAEPESQTITIVKDNLKAVPARDFNLGIEYGAVYTIKRPDSWEIIYNGTIVNSLHEPVPVKNLTLYFEDFDEFVEIATIDTDENSNFYFNYTKYGNIEQNPLVRIMYKGDGLYNPLDHIEYGGIEMGADQNWWFYDDDRNGWPEWPFTLYDLFAALQIESSPTTSDLSVYLAWMAEFNENSGTSTFDIVSNLEGLLKGNTSWTSGRRDSGLLFDGDGIITPPQSTGFVKSVQYKELVFSTSDVTKSIALDVGTNISNTIPFVTIKENVGDD
nr:hypothetical protein [Candidatus Anoxychlamydiales bacterium]